MRFKMILEVSYPNVTSESWSKGGDIFSVSGNLGGSDYEGPKVFMTISLHTGISPFPLRLAE